MAIFHGKRRAATAFVGAAAALATTVALVGCAGGAGSGEGDAASVDGGFAEMEPITLITQSPYGPDHFMSKMWVEYADVVEEKSEGKITFDISYASALVPVAEQEAALRDGLLDIAWSMPAYNPGELPVNAMLTEVAFLTEQTPIVSQLQGYGSSEFGFTQPAIEDEITNAGFFPLITLVQQQPHYPLLCASAPATTLDEFAGKRIRVPGAGWATEVEALGATPVNLPQAEVYEALERGVIDCAIVAFGNSAASGLFDVTDYWMVDTQVGFQGWNSTQIIIADRIWNELPAVAQQLLWEESHNTLLRSMIDETMAAMADEIVAADEMVEILEYDDEVREVLTAQREKTLADVDQRLTAALGDQSLLDDYAAMQQEWLDLVLELGYSDEENPTWFEWATAYVENPTDIDPFMDAYMERVTAKFGPNAG